MRIIVLTFVAFLITSCGSREIGTPKPRGYFRIEFPKKAYQHFDATSPFSFDYPTYAILEQDTDFNKEADWFNLQFPGMKATLHLSYKPIKGDIKKLLEDSRSLVYKHTVKAEAIDETLIIDDQNAKFGVYYTIKGDAASSFQFIVTDSCNHLMRGALYFKV